MCKKNNLGHLAGSLGGISDQILLIFRIQYSIEHDLHWFHLPSPCHAQNK